MVDTVDRAGGYPLKLVDNGDGSFSPAVAVVANSGLLASNGWGALSNGGAVGVLDSGLVGDGEVLGVNIATFATGATVVVEVTADPGASPTAWVQVRGMIPNTGGATASITGTGYFVFPIAGACQWRVRQTAWTSGTTTGFSVVTKGAAAAAREVSVNNSIILASGSNFIGSVGANANNGTGGFTTTSRIASAAASTNATSAKTSAGRVFKARAYNTTAAVKFLKFYNKASAPTVGTDAVILTVALKPNDTTEIDFGMIGYYFSTGIAYAITGAAADADTTALTAGDVVGVNVVYA